MTKTNITTTTTSGACVDVEVAMNMPVVPHAEVGLLVFNALADPLLIIADDQLVVDCNPAAEEFFSIDRHTISAGRRTLCDLLEGFANMADRAETAIHDTGSWNGKLTIHDRHGIARRVDITLLRQRGNQDNHLTVAMCHDTTEQHSRLQNEQRRIQQSMRDSELRFWRVADAAPVMIWQTDREGKRSYVNRRLLAFTGRVADREFDNDWMTDVHPDDRERCRSAIQQAFSAREIFEVDYRLRQHNGEFRWLVDNGMPRYGTAGVFEGYVGSCIDITPYKKLEHILQLQTNALVAEATRKDAFLAMLSHELRNPMAPIANSLAVMRTSSFDDPLQKNSFAIVERQFNHLRRLVNDLLDVDRIAGGKIKITKKPVAVRQIVERALESSMPVLLAAHHRLSVDLTHPNLRVCGDLMRLAQALTNLLDNAAKFTRDGGLIVLAVDTVDTDVCFAVRDNGIGFSKQFQQQLFTPFEQADQSLARTRSGLGIGLAMAHQIAQLHGGTVTASSNGEGCGSQFVLTLPVLPEPGLTAHLENPFDLHGEEPTVSPETEKGAGFRILLVDDNEDANDSMAALLELLDYDVRTATDGASALKVTAEFEPQLILSDIGLPGMDGYQLAPALRKVAGSRKVVIAAATGYGHASDRARSMAAGFDHHLVKPLDADALLAFVARQAADY